MIFYKSIGGNIHFLMKKSLFFFPFSCFLKAIGGFQVNRSKKSFISEQMVDEFSRRKRFQLAVAPEGTRKKNTKWKTGFYYIALKAQVPITLAYLDYKKKVIGAIENFIPSGDVTKDMDRIKQVYKNVCGRHPEKFAI
jgi:1-acyl-sn-glycerol-3-phosphate acyltransferase